MEGFTKATTVFSEHPGHNDKSHGNWARGGKGSRRRGRLSPSRREAATKRESARGYALDFLSSLKSKGSVSSFGNSHSVKFVKPMSHNKVANVLLDAGFNYNSSKSTRNHNVYQTGPITAMATKQNPGKEGGPYTSVSFNWD